MRSMKAMALLAPQIKELKEKYKDDRQRLQVETMALYKQHGVNPLSGCSADLPADADLARAVPDARSAGELYTQPFIPAGSTT